MSNQNWQDQLVELIRDIADQIHLILTNFYKPYGLPAVQASVLSELDRGGPRNLTDLADALTMGKSNLSPLCKRMEAAGFLHRVRDQDDQRVVHIDLTDYARQVMEEIHRNIESDYVPTLTPSSEEEREKMLEGLLLLRSHLRPVEG